MMEYRMGGLIFSSDFDSGNLARVEKASPETCEEPSSSASSISHKNGSSVLQVNTTNNSAAGNVSIFNLHVDHDFKIWTKPDCFGTEFENGNRTWFYFSVRGYYPGKLMRIKIMNLNKQSKIYSQGYAPLYKVCHSTLMNSKWQRIRDRPAWDTTDGQFFLTFVHRFTEPRGSTTYFAFCFPWTYTDTQTQLAHLDMIFCDQTGPQLLPSNPQAVPIDCESSQYLDADGQEISSKQKSSMIQSQELLNQIYFHRELLCYSLEGRRIDLITLTDWSGRLDTREDYFDPLLFPDRTKPRPWKFSGKKVVLITARVHPGETPSSHVFNGLLELLLRPHDKRACQLRQQYLFKLIPLLNPDGVFHGHYRTDTRGVNLNRVYLEPDFLYYPSIYACKALVVYHHTIYATLSPYASFLEEVFQKLISQSKLEMSGKSHLSFERSGNDSATETPMSDVASLAKLTEVPQFEKSTILPTGENVGAEVFAIPKPRESRSEMSLRRSAQLLRNTSTELSILTEESRLPPSCLSRPHSVQDSLNKDTMSVKSNSQLLSTTFVSDEPYQLANPPNETHLLNGEIKTKRNATREEDKEGAPTRSNESARSGQLHGALSDQVTDATETYTVNQSSHPVELISSGAKVATKAKSRVSSANSVSGSGTSRNKRKGSSKWGKTQRSISTVGCRLTAIRNSCKSSRLVAAFRNRRRALIRMDCLPCFFTKWNAPLQQTVTNHTCLVSSTISPNGVSSTRNTKAVRDETQATCVVDNSHMVCSTADEQTLSNRLEEAEFRSTKSEPMMQPSIIVRAKRNEAQKTNSSFRRAESVITRAQVHPTHNRIFNEATAQHLNQDLYSLSSIECEPGNEGSDQSETGDVERAVQTDNSNRPDENFDINPQFLQLLDHAKSRILRNVYPNSSILSNGVEVPIWDLFTEQLNELRRGKHLAASELRQIKPDTSGMAFYIDLHGHCSKRGCFLYGNWLDAEEEMINNVLYALLVNINSIYFDFNSCNFSVRNMYQKDRKGSLTKEGSGRVAIWKHLGLIHCYTLECNYNTGPIMSRLARCLASATPDETGRLTPPGTFFGPHWTDLANSLGGQMMQPSVSVSNTTTNGGAPVHNTNTLPFLTSPPRYTPAHYEEVGRSLLIAMLDLMQTNPWPRVSTLGGPNAVPGIGNIPVLVGMPEFAQMKVLKEWVRRYVKGLSSSGAGGGHSVSMKASNSKNVQTQAISTTDQNKESGERSLATCVSSQRLNRASKSVVQPRLTPVSTGTPSMVTGMVTSTISNDTASNLLADSTSNPHLHTNHSPQRGPLNPVRYYRPQPLGPIGASQKVVVPRMLETSVEFRGSKTHPHSVWTPSTGDLHLASLSAKLSEDLVLDDSATTSLSFSRESRPRTTRTDCAQIHTYPRKNSSSEANSSNTGSSKKSTFTNVLSAITHKRRESRPSKTVFFSWNASKQDISFQGDDSVTQATTKQSLSARTASSRSSYKSSHLSTQKRHGDELTDAVVTNESRRRGQKHSSTLDAVLFNYVANAQQRRKSRVTLTSARISQPLCPRGRTIADGTLTVRGEPLKTKSVPPCVTNIVNTPKRTNNKDSNNPGHNHRSSTQCTISECSKPPKRLSGSSSSESLVGVTNQLFSSQYPINLPEMGIVDHGHMSSSHKIPCHCERSRGLGEPARPRWRGSEKARCVDGHQSSQQSRSKGSLVYTVRSRKPKPQAPKDFNHNSNNNSIALRDIAYDDHDEEPDFGWATGQKQSGYEDANVEPFDISYIPSPRFHEHVYSGSSSLPIDMNMARTTVQSDSDECYFAALF